jgi:hypothetical protein
MTLLVKLLLDGGFCALEDMCVCMYIFIDQVCASIHSLNHVWLFEFKNEGILGHAPATTLQKPCMNLGP